MPMEDLPFSEEKGRRGWGIDWEEKREGENEFGMLVKIIVFDFIYIYSLYNIMHITSIIYV